MLSLILKNVFYTWDFVKWWKWLTIALAILLLIIIITAIAVSIQKDRAKKEEEKKKKEEEEEKKKKEKEKQKKEEEEKKKKEETPPPKKEDYSPKPKFDLKKFLQELKLKDKKKEEKKDNPYSKSTADPWLKPKLEQIANTNRQSTATPKKNTALKPIPNVVPQPNPNPQPQPQPAPQPNPNPQPQPQPAPQPNPNPNPQPAPQPPNLPLPANLKLSQNKLKNLGTNPASLSQAQSAGNMKIGKGLKCPPNIVLTDAGHGGLNFGGDGLNKALREMYGLSETELAHPDNHSQWDFITPDMDAFKQNDEKNKRKFGTANSCFCEIFNVDYKGNKNKIIYLVGPDYPGNKKDFAEDLKLTLDKYTEKVEELGKPPESNAVVFHGVSNNIFAGNGPGDFGQTKFSINGSNFNIIDLAEFLYLNEEIKKKPNAKLVFAGAISAANKACNDNIEAVKATFNALQTTNKANYDAIENAFHITEKLNNYQHCSMLSNIDANPPQIGLDEANGMDSPTI